MIDPDFIAGARSRHTRKPLHDRINKLFRQLDEWELPVVATELLLIDKEIEATMGQYATAISSLEALVTSQASTITTLQTQLAAATALEPDSSDVSAVEGVAAFVAANTPATPTVTGTGATATGTGAVVVDPAAPATA